MTELELLQDLLSSTESLNYGEYKKAEFLQRRAAMAFSNIFGDDCHYCELIWKIQFDGSQRKKVYAEELEEIWCNGQAELVSLIKVALEEFEVFKLPSKAKETVEQTYEEKYEGLLYTITKYLSEQRDSTDKNLAVLLNYAELMVNRSNTNSNRLYCCWVTAVICVPAKIKGKFSDAMIQRLLSLLNEFRPLEWDIDFYDIAVQPKVESAYENWRNDILKNLIGEGISNQASFKSTSYPMFEYNGVKFRSKSEKSLAPIFEKSKILFFPLPLAISGTERKEPDFLVCQNGKWAILEVVNDHFHPSVEKEADRTNWFQNHHVLIRSYSSKKCIESPQWVVNDFLNWLEGVSQ